MQAKVETPTPEQVKGIYKDTYLFFLKYINIKSDIEFEIMIQESKELYKKYPFELCKVKIIELCNIIDNYAKQRMNYGKSTES
jgi:hypothetical protein